MVGVADEVYTDLCLRLADLQREAGAFLGRSLRGASKQHTAAHRMAVAFAIEANQVSDQMKAWRLANGYDQ